MGTKQVWIIDNELDTLESLKDRVSMDAQVITFPSCNAAISALTALTENNGNPNPGKMPEGARKPDLIITDYDTGAGENGLAVLEKAQALKIPAIMISGSNVKEQAMSLGAYGYLRKPYNGKDLSAMVKKSLNPEIANSWTR